LKLTLSAIFYHDQKQKELAGKSKRDLEKAGIHKDPIVTENAPVKNFYVAENYHKNYMKTIKMLHIAILLLILK
jgi:peptide methionine sulfoxide reductase MsrA